MSSLGSYLMGSAGGVRGFRTCSDKGLKRAKNIRTSEHGELGESIFSAELSPVLRPTSEQNRQKRARTRAECITIPKRGHQNMPLTSWGAGGVLRPCPPKARPNRIQTRGRLALSSGEVPVAPRWCTVTYIEGESSMPNDVSSDLERFDRKGRLPDEAALRLNGGSIKLKVGVPNGYS